jgi:hypothetical protein
MNRYAKEALEIESRIKVLQIRKTKFESHPTLHTRVTGIVVEINELMPAAKALWNASKWSNEISGPHNLEIPQ